LLSVKSSEFLAFLDDLVERVILRMCTPARGHFVELTATRISRIATITNGTPSETRQALRRLADEGRIVETTRYEKNRTVRGIVCLPLWKRPAHGRLTASDRKFLRRCGTSW
jgi:hypothetical protein